MKLVAVLSPFQLYAFVWSVMTFMTYVWIGAVLAGLWKPIIVYEGTQVMEVADEEATYLIWHSMYPAMSLFSDPKHPCGTYFFILFLKYKNSCSSTYRVGLKSLVKLKRLDFQVELRRALGAKMKQLPFMGVVCTVMLFFIYRTTIFQYQQTEVC